MRTNARETVFKIVFASQFTQNYDEAFIRAMYRSEKLDGDDITYCNSLLKTIKEKNDELLNKIDSLSYLFPSGNLFPADKSALLIAFAEIYYFDDIPYAVSANEAANLASKYSTEKSASFISGIISEVIRGLQGD